MQRQRSRAAEGATRTHVHLLSTQRDAGRALALDDLVQKDDKGQYVAHVPEESEDIHRVARLDAPASGRSTPMQRDQPAGVALVYVFARGRQTAACRARPHTATMDAPLASAAPVRQAAHRRHGTAGLVRPPLHVSYKDKKRFW